MPMIPNCFESEAPAGLPKCRRRSLMWFPKVLSSGRTGCVLTVAVDCPADWNGGMGLQTSVAELLGAPLL